MMNIIKPLTDDELLVLLNDLESDRVERKRSFKNETEKARQTVCAFANDLPAHNQPGILFIGAEDSGAPSNISVTDELLLRLSDMKTDGNILPLPALTVEKRILKGAEMAVVTVYPSDATPIRYQGRIWIRTGPRRAVATAQEERMLNEKRRYHDKSFDVHPVNAARIGDLSRAYFEDEYLPKVFAPDILEENNRSYEERLSSLKMIVSPDDTTPTVLGVLSIGKRPQEFLNGAYIQFVCFDGNELSASVTDEAKIEGRFIDMILHAEYKLIAHNRTRVDTSKGPHIMSYDYPHRSFQQILYNAVMHRNYEGTNSPVRVYWYNNRVEISNPGGPYGDVTIENFGKPGINDYRNPNIADVFKSLGYVQRYGTGIQIARSEMEKNDNPPLEYDVDTSFTICRLKAKKEIYREAE